jgi:alkylation response protein AidB-like acyl-CoA dehydrogenase
MTGDHKFSEVFLTDVRVPAARVLADLGRGWELTTATLKLERTVIGPGGDGGGMADNHKRPPLDRPAGEVAAVERAGQQRGAMVTGAGGMALIRTLLERFGGGDEPVVRQDVARLYTLLEVVRWTGRRGADASTLKLLTGRGTIALRDLALRLEGPHGGLSGEDAALGGVVQKLALTSPSMSIMAGTDEIQRNLIGERVLGLPREP